MCVVKQNDKGTGLYLPSDIDYQAAVSAPELSLLVLPLRFGSLILS